VGTVAVSADVSVAEIAAPQVSEITTTEIPQVTRIAATLKAGEQYPGKYWTTDGQGE